MSLFMEENQICFPICDVANQRQKEWPAQLSPTHAYVKSSWTNEYGSLKHHYSFSGVQAVGISGSTFPLLILLTLTGHSQGKMIRHS